ncbi:MULTISPECIES: trypsin-like peptidase domain-containing protein [unclassified Streptomyces]|uniref:trypsin-like peptidase domain-containing protein n=1 Tax=unclassified Streptomyces TaxID=2593676 RepID=UPI003866CE1A
MTGLASRLAERPPWLARFPHPHGESVAGAGVLVGPRHVLTCAHVLEKQLGRPLPAPGPDLAAHAEEVEVEFPFAGEPGTAGNRMRGTLVGWVPIPAARSDDEALLGAANDSGDVALLELESPVGCTPAPLACPPTLDGHRFSVHGFPDGDPVARQANGVLRGASGEAGTWVQLDAESATGWAIEMGFSGAPVFDHSREAVVGIVVVRDKRETRTGHMLPMSYLRTLWPEVRSNCRWRLDLEASYRSHWRPRARGSEPDSPSDEWFFTGRTEARRVICDWLEGKDLTLAERPILLVTGGPGSGKSALLAHSLVSADPLLAETVPRSNLSDPRPPVGAFNVALHLRGRTCDEMTVQLAHALDVTGSDSGELLAAVGRLPSSERFTVLADAVEEAADLKEALQIAALLRQLANTGRVRVLAAVRTAPAGTSRARILSNFGRGAAHLIDLEDSRYLHHPDIAEYVVRRLTSEQADSARYGAYEPNRLCAIGEAVALKARYNFLIAQLTAGWLIRRNVQAPGSGEADWEDKLPTTVGDAMDAYLDTCGADSETLRRLLTALAYARGDGLPRSETWLTMADALGFGVRHSAEDREKIFQSAAHYLVERVSDGSGLHQYRLYHDALDQHLRRECERDHHAPEVAITAALVGAVPERDGQHDWAGADAYTRDHLASHAAAAGQLDDLLTTDTEYLVHAAPRGLTPLLHHARSGDARLTAAVYRTSLSLHAIAPPDVRRQVLALDAARAGADVLQQQLIRCIPAGNWTPRWATGSGFIPALRDTIDSHADRLLGVACTEVHGTPVMVTGGGMDGTVQVWDLTTGAPFGQPLVGHTKRVRAVACAELDGTPIAVTGSYDGTVRVWDLTTDAPLGQPFTGHVGGVSSVACTEIDGIPVAVTGGDDLTVRVWDLAKGTPIGQPIAIGHAPRSINSGCKVACTVLDGVPVAVVVDSNTLGVWDLATGIPIGQPLVSTPLGHMRTDLGYAPMVACAQVEGAPVAVTGGPRGTVLVWDLATGTRKPLADHTDWVLAVACTVLDGSAVVVTASSDNTVRVWDLATGSPIGHPLTGLPGEFFRLACTVLDGRPVAVTANVQTLRVWDLALHAPLGQPVIGHSRRVSAVACVEVDGAPVAVTASERDNTVRVWDLTTGAPINQPLAGHTGWASTVACTEVDGTPVAVTGGGDWTLRLWDLARGTPIGQPLPTGDSEVTAVACTVLNGTPVAVTGCTNGQVQMWDLAAGTPIGQPLTGHSGRVSGVACTEVAGNPVAVTGGGDWSVRLWDLARGTPIGQPLPTGVNNWVMAVACTVLDGAPVAVTANHDDVRVWDLTLRTPIGRPLTGHTRAVSAVACAVLNGIPVAVTASYDNTVRVWNVHSGEMTGLLVVSDPRAVALTAQGDLVVGMSHDVAVFRRCPAPTPC